MPGIDSTGFVVKTLEEIQTDLKTGYRGVFGAGVDLEPESVDGMEIGINSERLAEAWSAIGLVYQSAFPDGADGVNLDNVAAITGCARLPATLSKVDLLCTGTPGTVLAAGRIVSVVDVPDAKFTNAGSATIGGGGTVTVEFKATATGPRVAPAGTLTVIETPVSGWASATNLLDQKIKGTDQEKDPALRLRREASLRGLGNASVAAIRSKVLAVANVVDCFVFENASDSVDASGLPAHTVEAVIAGGTDLAVGQALYDSKAGGIATYGTTSQGVTDSNGWSQLVKFSRPAALNVYVKISIRVDPKAFPADGDAQIKAAAVAWALLVLHTGSAVVSSIMLRDAFDTIPGVLEFVGLPLIGLSNPATVSTTIQPTNHQKAAFDTSRITVVHL